MKNIFKILLPITVSLIFCQSNQARELSKEEIIALNKQYLQKQGLPDLDGEVKISKAKIILSSSKDKYYNSQINQFLKMHQEQQRNGFVEDIQPRAKELLEFENSSEYQFKKYKNAFSMKGTFLRQNPSDLIMAYHYTGVPESIVDHMIGVSPYGAFKETKYGDEATGWDGAIQFFTKKGIGTCEYKEHNLKLAHGGVELINELVSYEIYNKPTVILVQGTKNSAYLYQVSWYDDNFSRQLFCANPNFSNQIKENVIELARAIEKAQ